MVNKNKLIVSEIDHEVYARNAIIIDNFLVILLNSFLLDKQYPFQALKNNHFYNNSINFYKF